MRPPVIEDFWKTTFFDHAGAHCARPRRRLAADAGGVELFAGSCPRARCGAHAFRSSTRSPPKSSSLGFATICVESAAPDRAAYLRRPDWGRTLSERSRALLEDRQAETVDIAIVVADGLSATAVHSQAVQLLAAFKPYLIRAGLAHGACRGREPGACRPGG